MRLAQLFQYDGSGMADAVSGIRERQKQSKLASLLAGAYGAEGGNRQAMLQQAIGVDPQAGFAAARFLDPRLQQAAGGVQSTYVDADGNRVAIMRDGSSRVLGGNDMGMSQQTVSVEGPDGRPVQYTFDKRTGSYRNMQLGGPTAAQGVQVQYDGPPEDRAAFEQVVAADAGQPFAPGNYSATLPPQNAAPQQRQWTQNTPNPYGNAMPGVGMAPGEKAYAQEAAQQQAQLQYKPLIEQATADVQYGNMGRVGDMEATNAAKKAEAEALAKARAEQAGKVAVRARDDRESLMLLSQAAGLLKTATSGGAEEMWKGANRYVGRTTEGAKADAQLNILSGKLIGKVPRFEGPQSNIDVQLYQQMAGDLANPNKTRGERIAAAQGMIDLIKRYQDYAAQQKKPASAPAKSGVPLRYNPATGDFE